MDSAKENAMPAKIGYKLQDLTEANDAELEKQLQLNLQKLLIKREDDEIAPFLDYLQWVKSKFPKGHPSAKLVQEQTIRNFRKDPKYKNDPRYIELWMNMARKQENPSDLFKYLAMNGIGQELAMYYFEYASFKETGGYIREASEIYKLGISRKAKPVEKLEKQYEKFKLRTAHMPAEPSNSTLTRNADSKNKNRIFKDHSDTMDSLDQQKRPSKKIKREKNVKKDERKAAHGDDLHHSLPPPISEGSRLGFNANLCYIKDAEYCFEENRAALCHSEISETRNSLTDNSSNVFLVEESMDLMDMKSENTPQKPIVRPTSSAAASPWHPPTNPNESPSTPRAEGPIEDIFKMLDNGSASDSPLPNLVDSTERRKSPIIPAKTGLRAISGMFADEDEDEPSDPNVIVYNPEDDETISKQVYKRPQASSFKIGVFHDEDDTEEIYHVESTPAARTGPSRLFNPVHVMTPVTERSDRTHHTVANSFIHTELPIEELEETTDTKTSMLSSGKKSPNYVAASNPCNPSESQIRQAVLTLVKPPPESKVYMYPSRSSTLGSRLSMAIKNSEMNVVDDEFITFIEEIDSESFAIQRPGRKQSIFKILSPPSIWEYYILFLVQSKIPKELKNCTVSPHCCYLFQNESILETDCPGSDSLLDIVSKTKGGLDEMVVSYFTLQILTILDAIHSIGIVHGDLRIGNFMIRSLSESFNDFDVTGNQGWTNFALCLKDWSASINLNAFPQGQKFQIEASAESEEPGECWEFQNGKEWTFEPDWYGASGVIHILAYGDVIENNLFKSSSSGQRPEFSLKDTVQDSWTIDADLWNDVFSTLINLSHTSAGSKPLASLCKIRYPGFPEEIVKMGNKVIVIKVGTSSICDEKTFCPKLANLSLLVETVVRLLEVGHKVVLVSSGAIGTGLRRLKLSKRPKSVAASQAVAAVGQGRLMAMYDTLFAPFEIAIAQILLSRDNLSERSSYLNACNTLQELLAMNAVPIINENDSVSSSEIRFGDNDSLSAIVAGMVHADHLFLLTDVDSLYTDNPRSNPDAKRISVVKDIVELRNSVNVSSPGSAVGTGGMVTKLIAAELATTAGCSMIISIGTAPQKILAILDEIELMEKDSSFQPTIGTHFVAVKVPQQERYWWILNSLSTCGTLFIDEGALKAITRKDKSSLFAAGIKRVEGSFNAQQCVEIVSLSDNKLIGKGIVNYSSFEIQRILGMKSKDIANVLGYVETEYVIHRDNLAIK